MPQQKSRLLYVGMYLCASSSPYEPRESRGNVLMALVSVRKQPSKIVARPWLSYPFCSFLFLKPGYLKFRGEQVIYPSGALARCSCLLYSFPLYRVLASSLDSLWGFLFSASDASTKWGFGIYGIVFSVLRGL